MDAFRPVRHRLEIQAMFGHRGTVRAFADFAVVLPRRAVGEPRQPLWQRSLKTLDQNEKEQSWPSKPEPR